MATPIGNIATAIRAYGDAAHGRAPGLDSRDSTPHGGFADLVKGTLKQSVANGASSERQAMAAVDDRADLSRVVTAVAEAELTLKTVVAVRDRVLEAYKDILRMPI